MSLSGEQEILLREYEQAGEACRNHDSLIRTGLAIFGAAQAAILAFVSSQSKPIDSLEIVMLEALGLWLGVVVLMTTFRLHHRYSTYMSTIHAIEAKLGISLYSDSQKYFESKWYLKLLPGNKYLWASVPGLAVLIYLVLLCRDIKPFLPECY